MKEVEIVFLYIYYIIDYSLVNNDITFIRLFIIKIILSLKG